MSKGLSKLYSVNSNPSPSDGSPLPLDSYTGAYYSAAGGQIYLYQKVGSSFVTFPWISGDYRSQNSYDSKCYSFWDYKSPMYFEFFSNKQIDVNSSGTYSQSNVKRDLELITYNYIAGDFNLFHYIFKFKPNTNYYSLNFNFWSGGSNVRIVPIFLKYESELTNAERSRVGLPTVESAAINNLQSSNDENFKKQIAEAKKQHEEAMDTSKVTEVNGIADGLVKTGNEKTKSLLYPVQWAIDTAHNLASAPSTGIISIPVIFGTGTFDIDLTVIERNIPSVWSFIQNFIRFIVSIGILRGIFGLFKGVDG